MPGRGGQRYERSDSGPPVQGFSFVEGGASFAMTDYKHSAPLEPGGDGMPGVLQTFGSAGAGKRWDAGVLQTFGSAGAGGGGAAKHKIPSCATSEP